MKFRKREYYITDSRKNTVKQNKAYKIEMMMPDEPNTDYVFKLNGVLDKLERSVIARLRRHTVQHEIYMTEAEHRIMDIAKLEMIKINDGYRFRKPAEVIYTIMDYRLIIWKCTNITFSYNLGRLSAEYSLFNICILNNKVENLYRMIYGCGDTIEISNEEIKQWKRDSKTLKTRLGIESIIMKCAEKY